MINTLIVDDEHEIRKGLQLKVDWFALGFHIAAEAIDGLDAIEKLHLQKIELVITDMLMPNMNGVQLLSYLNENYPHIKVIVLTGYDDFSYTKAAIKHNAVEYLLKPVLADELEQTLLHIKTLINKDNERKLKQKETSHWNEKWLCELQENFCLHILKGDASSLILSKLNSIQLQHWQSKSIRVVSLGLQTNAQLVEQFQLPFELLIRELIAKQEDQILVCKDTSYSHLLYLIVNESIKLDRLIEQLKEVTAAHIKRELVVGVSEYAKGFTSWHQAYMDAILQWSLNNSQLQQQATGEGELHKLNADTLDKLFHKNDKHGLLLYIQTHLTHALFYSPAQYIKTLFEIIIALEHIWHDRNSLIKQDIWLSPEKIVRLTTVDKALDYIEQYLDEVYAKKSTAVTDDLFIDVLKEIEQNYVYELTLPMLAKKYNYNVSYFSELFKAKVGKSFVHYITDLRMQHACRLLQSTDLGLSDIAELTGFSNASYFSSRFKKMFDISPSEYRQQQSTVIN